MYFIIWMLNFVEFCRGILYGREFCEKSVILRILYKIWVKEIIEENSVEIEF